MFDGFMNSWWRRRWSAEHAAHMRCLCFYSHDSRLVQLHLCSREALFRVITSSITRPHVCKYSRCTPHISYQNSTSPKPPPRATRFVRVRQKSSLQHARVHVQGSRSLVRTRMKDSTHTNSRTAKHMLGSARWFEHVCAIVVHVLNSEYNAQYTDRESVAL